METLDIARGETVTKGQRICYMESGTNYSEIVSDRSGKIRKMMCNHGDFLMKGEPIIEFA
ncbi:MAG: hypothetical protein LC649_04245 [Bacteroidales bacterium]|nr:hypothetical protein [Bacteroidales bacterium]